MATVLIDQQETNFKDVNHSAYKFIGFSSADCNYIFIISQKSLHIMLNFSRKLGLNECPQQNCQSPKRHTPGSAVHVCAEEGHKSFAHKQPLHGR